MRARKVVSWDQLPVRLPVMSSITAWLALDKIHASDWTCGMVGMGFVLLWIGSIAAMIKEEKTKLRELE